MALPKIEPVHVDEARHLRIVDASLTSQMRIEQIAKEIIANEYVLKDRTYTTDDLTERFYAAGREETAEEWRQALSNFCRKGDWESKTTIVELLTNEADALAAELYVIEVGL